MSRKPASTWRCPSCGAPCGPDAARCDYCRTRLATVSCPSCFGLLVEGTAYCPQCGAARSRAERTRDEPEGPPTRCPACRGGMRWVQVGAADLLECDRCDGTWIEAAAFDRLCRDRESQAAVLGISADPSRAPAERPAHVRYRPCPRCGKLMNRTNFGRLSGAIVDVCRGHGTFLDRGELHQIVRFVEGGGLDRLRAAERDELRDEQQRLRSLTPRQAGAPPLRSTTGWSFRSLHDFLTALFGPEALR